MKLQFNIIYTPGTVKYLSCFVWSLLKHLDCSFRLVSNGCLPPEQSYLQRLCQQHNCLEFWAIPTKKCLPHGLALNYLQGLNQSDWFCFLDSDILAIDNFLQELPSDLDQYTGIFSGAPIWITTTDELLPQTFQIMSGVYNRTDNGVCLGSTFLAIYNNQALTELMQSTGIGFEEYKWQEIPVPYQKHLSQMGLVKEGYDTAKLLNLLFLAQGDKLIYQDLPSLCHIGGISFIPLSQNSDRSVKNQILNHLPQGFVKSQLSLWIEKIKAQRIYPQFRHLSPEEFKAIVAQRQQQRDPTRSYFFKLLQALSQNTSLPPMPTIGITEIDQKIALASDAIQKLYQECKLKFL